VSARKRQRSANNLARCTTGALSQRPGLSALGEIFKLPDKREVPFWATVEFDAKFECNTRPKQLVRASPKFKNKQPWSDAILFTVENSGASQDGATSAGGGDIDGDGSDVDNHDLYAGEVRAIVRCKNLDYDIILKMDVVGGEPGCPFVSRFSTHFKWADSAAGGQVIGAVPMHNVTRVIHVVPDFMDLASRKGMAAASAGYSASSADRDATRVFLNEFYPWG